VAIDGFPPAGKPLSARDLERISGAAAEPYRSPLVAARLLRLLAVAAAAAAAVSAAYVNSASDVFRKLRRDPLSVVQGDFVDIAHNIGRIYIFLIGVTIVTTILLIAWLRRMYRNLPSLGKHDTRFRPGWAVGAWFVPILNWIRPKQMIDEVWHAGDLELPDSYTYSTEREPVPAVVNFWWGFWVVGSVLGGVVRAQLDISTLGKIETALNVELFTSVAIVVTMLLLERVAATVTVRHQRRAAQVGRDPGALRWVLTPRVDGRLAPSRIALIAAPAIVATASYALGVWAIGVSLEGGTGLTAQGGEAVLLSDLVVGDCVDLPTGAYIVVVARLPCDVPHDAEALASLSLGGVSDPYPGLDTVLDRIVDHCVAVFDDYVDADYLSSSLDIFYLYPDADNWSAGNHSAQCAVVTLDGSKLTRSVKGSGL
jgi:hypothetical protein